MQPIDHSKKPASQPSQSNMGGNAELPYYTANLDENGLIEFDNDRKQFIVPTGTEVRFQLNAGTKISNEAKLCVNMPIVNKNFLGSSATVDYTYTQPFISEDQEKFEGSDLSTTHFEEIEPAKESQYMLEFKVKFDYSGSYFIQINHIDEQTGDHSYTKPQYINVEPVMHAGGKTLRPKELNIITMMSRCLGQIDRWPEVLKNQRELGYNAVHFTPIQVYGASESHYSIADQLEMDDYYFSSKLTGAQKLSKLSEVLDHTRKGGMLSVIDIVLNHTAFNSEWICEHPDACYNTDDCPHLWSAWLLDKGIRDFSNAYARKQVPELSCAPYISNESDLGKVMNHIKNKVYEPLKLYEFFLCNVDQVINNVFTPACNASAQEMDKSKKFFDRRGWFQRDHFELIRDRFTINVGGPTRMGISLKPEAAHFFMMTNNRNKNAAVNEVRRLLCQLNDDWMNRCNGFKQEAYNAIEGTMRYFKIECGRNKVSTDGSNMIVDPYFSELNNQQRSKVAHNGWIGGWNCVKDFGYEGWNYLRRTINIWGDCVKLRYGNKPADSPYLWKHMTKYVQDMASVADGFRLDNTHSTPMHVGQYLLQAARCKNPNLFVMAELFTDSSQLDALFCTKLNINGLVRELQNRGDAGSTGDYFHKLSCQQAILGQIDDRFTDILGKKYKVLMPSMPCDILYDCTHDNPSVVEKFQTGRMALPHAGLMAVADISIASTWGVDQLVHKQIHCVTEKRVYPVYDQRNFYQDDPTQYDLDKPEQKETIQVSMVQPATDFEVEFSLENHFASKVSVAGEFNGWNKDATPLQRKGTKWVRAMTLPLGGKAQYQYKFVVNGTDWVTNDSMPITDDGRGNRNNVINVPGGTAAQGGFGGPSFSVSMPRSSSRQINLGEKVFDDLRPARMILNRVHEHCTRLDASIFLHQQADDVIVVTRQLPLDAYGDFDTYVSIQRYCFYNKGGDYNYSTSIELPGFMTEVVFAGYLEINDSVYNDPGLHDKQHIYGPKGCKLISSSNIEGVYCHREKINEFGEKLNFFKMPPSFTCVVKVKTRTYVKEAIQRLNMIDQDPRIPVMFDHTPSSGLNHVLFRCDPEEKDISNGTRGTYGFQEYGCLPYSGIASLMHMVKKVKLYKDLGCEMFNNIRQGDWLLDYTVSRIVEYNQTNSDIGLSTYGQFLTEYAGLIKKLPSYLKPKYVSQLIETCYNIVVNEIMSNRMQDEFNESSLDPFMQKMTLAIYQMWGRIPSVYFSNHKDSMCAGLTHFSTGYVRCWGRDTFIALRGLFIATGLEKEARETILFFAKVMRHGLMPNLHDGGNNTRFNCRDASWFFMQAIKDYCQMTQEGYKFLNQKFDLKFQEHQGQKTTMTILELILNMIERHAQGIQFKEWNAGTKIDAHMKDEGFNIKIVCDDKTGFCFGGNKLNCGTWMDKMGSSDYTKNRGIPATPRDGAPVELVAMQYSVLMWCQEMLEKGIIKEQGVQSNRGLVKFGDWAKKIHDNFERCFYVPERSSEDNQHVIESKYVNRRGIYKDVFGSSDVYTDYQLRCNVGVAMAYAPELFDKKHAQAHLKNTAEILMEKNCMGIKTLDPKDRNYDGDYHNDDDKHGWNYHQGPEWVWPVGFFLKAQLIFNDYKTKQEAMVDTMKWLIPHKEHIMKDRWQGLPELTNSHGKHCGDSCVTQAWSISTLVDALRDLHYHK